VTAPPNKRMQPTSATGRKSDDRHPPMAGGGTQVSASRAGRLRLMRRSLGGVGGALCSTLDKRVSGESQ